VQRDYFIQDNAFGEPSLFRRENGRPPVELVEGVGNLQIEYGEDTTDDFFVDGYVVASGVTNWGGVTSVRPVLTLRSMSENVTLDNQRMEQVMTSTIGLRNRLP